MATEKFVPKSLYAMLDHILNQAEQWVIAGEDDSDNKSLNRAWGAITVIADVKMDTPHWQRVNSLRDRIVKKWKALPNRRHSYHGLSAFDDDPDMWYGEGDPNDYGDQ